MKTFYSMSRKGFFSSELFDENSMPQDAVEISTEDYDALFQGQSDGKIISWDESAPCLKDRVFTNDELSSACRSQRNQLLSSSDWTQLPDVPDSVKTKWSVYRQALRDIPQQSGFPVDVEWPEQPQ